MSTVTIKGLKETFLELERRNKRITRARLFVRARSLVVFAVALFGVPTLVDLLSNPIRAPYRWLAADTFYYLVVGRNWAQNGHLAYDGTNASNGFQPLWQLWVCISELLRVHLRLGQLGPFLLAIAGLLLVSAAVWLLGLSLLRARRLSPLFLGVPVGVYGLTVLPAWIVGLRAPLAHQNFGWLWPVFGTLWSYVNGMESALVLFFFALALFLAAKREAPSSPRHAAYLGAALAGLTLARLDHAFYALALWMGYAIICERTIPVNLRRVSALKRLGPRVSAYRQPLVAGAVWTALVLPYLLYNKHHFGAYVPLSGVAKSTFPNFSGDNIDRILEVTRGTLPIDSDWWLPVACRQFQTVVPALFAGGYLVVRAFRPSRTTLTTLLTASALGLLTLAIYDFAFTHAGDQGFWYMPVSTLLPTLFVCNARPFRLRVLPRGAFVVAMGAAVVTFFCLWHRHPSYNKDYRTMMLKAGVEARDFYRGQPPKLVEIDDGVVSYSLDTKAMSSYLALDPEGFRAQRDGQLLDLAMKRGFDHVGSAVYHPYDFSDDALRGWVGAALHQDMTHFIVQKEFASSDNLLLIAKITRR